MTAAHAGCHCQAATESQCRTFDTSRTHARCWRCCGRSLRELSSNVRGVEITLHPQTSSSVPSQPRRCRHDCRWRMMAGRRSDSAGSPGDWPNLHGEQCRSCHRALCLCGIAHSTLVPWHINYKSVAHSGLYFASYFFFFAKPVHGESDPRFAILLFVCNKH